MEETAILLTAYIDTRSAGFGSTPHYMARIAGPREFEVPGSEVTRFVDAFTAITQPTSSGFTINARLFGGPVDQVLLDQIMNRWSVVWMGIEG